MSTCASTAVHTSCFFFNDTATTEIYTLSLHDALPILAASTAASGRSAEIRWPCISPPPRSEEHTSELQSHSDLVCRLLLEKKALLARTSGRDKDKLVEEGAFAALDDQINFIVTESSTRMLKLRFFFKDGRAAEVDFLSLHGAFPI